MKAQEVKGNKLQVICDWEEASQKNPVTATRQKIVRQKTEDKRKVRGMCDLLSVIGEEKFQVFSTRTPAMLDWGRLSNLGSS
jgi:hypothetical protein